MPTHFRPRTDPAGHPFRRTFGRRGHPFRRTFGRPSGHGRGHPIRALLKDTGAAVPLSTHDEDGDLKLFVLSFTAFFICFATFIF
jgi:hypothetical protein